MLDQIKRPVVKSEGLVVSALNFLWIIDSHMLGVIVWC